MHRAVHMVHGSMRASQAYGSCAGSTGHGMAMAGSYTRLLGAMLTSAALRPARAPPCPHVRLSSLMDGQRHSLQAHGVAVCQVWRQGRALVELLKPRHNEASCLIYTASSGRGSAWISPASSTRKHAGRTHLLHLCGAPWRSFPRFCQICGPMWATATVTIAFRG